MFVCVVGGGGGGAGSGVCVWASMGVWMGGCEFWCGLVCVWSWNREGQPVS